MKNGELRHILVKGMLTQKVLIVNPGIDGEDYTRYSLDELPSS